MRYLGGKTKVTKFLTSAIVPKLKGRTVWDPFCGGLSMTLALSEHVPVLATDVHTPLISLYQAVANGWDPPDTVSPQEYKEAQTLSDTDPLKAFVGFGCSFGGKYFGGYARDDKRNENYAQQTRNVLLRDIPFLTSRGSSFAVQNFLQITPAPDDTDLVLYLDPPYAGTTVYKGVDCFDHGLFWSKVALWSRYTDVFVSEYSCPFATVPLLTFDHPMNVASGSSREGRAEKLFWFGP